jgi:hypothetical protein
MGVAIWFSPDIEFEEHDKNTTDPVVPIDPDDHHPVDPVDPDV